MKRAIPMRYMVASLILTALTALATYAALLALGPDWAHYLTASCTATHCFCEFPRAGALVVQPAATWSSFAYVLVGWLMIVAAGARGRGSALGPVAARTLGATAILVGVGSALMHATLTLWGQFLDVVGMYLIGSFELVWALARWRRIGERRAVALFAALCVALIALLIAVPELRRWLFAVLLIGAIVVELVFARPLRPGVRVPLFLAGLATMALAFGIWILDQNGTLCAPHSLVQGHAVWHLLGAMSLGLLYAYYRSERAGGAAA
jgi:hypothetical protein